MASAVVGLYEQFLPDDTTIFVRIMDGTPDQLDRSKLQFRTAQEADVIFAQGMYPPEDLHVDYEVVPYSPTENSKSAQLKKLAEFFPMLSAAPQFVSQKKLFARVTDLLGLGDLTPDQAELQALAGPAGAPQTGAEPGQPQNGAPNGTAAAPDPGQIGTGTDESLKGGEMPASIGPPPITAEQSATGGGAGAKLPNALRAR